MHWRNAALRGEDMRQRRDCHRSAAFDQWVRWRRAMTTDRLARIGLGAGGLCICEVRPRAGCRVAIWR